jgi:DUF4097 and DUF4098 domain-containing protein YvlB
VLARTHLTNFSKYLLIFVKYQVGLALPEIRVPGAMPPASAVPRVSGMRMTGIRRTAAIAGLIGLVTVLTACGARTEDTVSYDVTDKVAALRVEVDSGLIDVVETDRRDVRVTERLSWTKDKPKTSHEVRGDRLELHFTCPVTLGVGMFCDVSYQIEVPKGLRVDVRSDSGDLTLRDLSGEWEATTDSGAIEATGVTGKRVATETESGDVKLSFTGQPDKVTTVTDSGRTVIRVPAGPYDIVAETDAGDKDIEVESTPSAQRKIELSSDSGDIEVTTT